MALTPGTCLGPFEILSALGVGVMGEVYRARDTTLNRDVAIKVLLHSAIITSALIIQPRPADSRKAT